MVTTAIIPGQDVSAVLGHILRLIQLLDELNQITRVTLADVVENETLPDSVFHFVPPSGVDVISDVE